MITEPDILETEAAAQSNYSRLDLAASTAGLFGGVHRVASVTGRCAASHASRRCADEIQKSKQAPRLCALATASTASPSVPNFLLESSRENNRGKSTPSRECRGPSSVQDLRNAHAPAMPRPPRRPAQPREATTTTPTRPTARNAITDAIPPFMLETPPHAPFVTTPVPPSNNPGNSIVPEPVGHRARNARQQPTPTANGIAQEHAPDRSQVSANALGSAVSEAGHGDEHSLLESAPHDPDDAKLLVGMRDISSLATWTISSSKPGCSLPQLRHPSPTYFWQSDGPQPHTLTLHFFKLVAIVKMRIYLDFELDESYTPTKMKFFAGMSEGGLVEFGGWEVQETTDPETGEVHSGVEGIRGWIEVPLKGVGGRETRYYEGAESTKTILASRKKHAAAGRDRPNVQGRPSKRGDRVAEATATVASANLETPDYVGGDVLKAMVVQVRICENHQNGKDTHVRGFQVFARDEGRVKEVGRKLKKEREVDAVRDETADEQAEVAGMEPADWMMEPEVR